ncbi:MAG: nucleotide exchange factor GrpE [Nitriliruptorales bacterium]|nr:nucleotide exchange factor GrpE [Nitriliruptorales bacterium]
MSEERSEDSRTGEDAPVPVEDAVPGEQDLAAVDDAGDAAPEPDDVAEDADEQPDWEVLASEDPRSRAELLAELTEAEARRDEYLEDVRRARAEFDNYRKRVMREGTSQRQAGIAELAGKLLDVLDDFDRTLEAANASPDESLKKGVELVYGNLVHVLKSVGLERIDETGVAFDPQRHEAVQTKPAEEPRDEPVVVEVYRPGYALGDRVLRAAMVVVEQ